MVWRQIGIIFACKNLPARLSDHVREQVVNRNEIAVKFARKIFNIPAAKAALAAGASFVVEVTRV